MGKVGVEEEVGIVEGGKSGGRWKKKKDFGEDEAEEEEIDFHRRAWGRHNSGRKADERQQGCVP